MSRASGRGPAEGDVRGAADQKARSREKVAPDQKVRPHAGRPHGPARSMSSIARSIALSGWLRRLAGFIAFDVLLALAFAGAFVWQAVMQLPPEARAGLAVSSNAPFPFALAAAPSGDVFDAKLDIRGTDGATYSFPLADGLVYAIPVGALVGVAELGALLSGPSETRRIRRKLKPLNDLALAAEAIGSAAASEGGAVPGAAGVPGAAADAGLSGHGGLDAGDRAKFASLEHAISSASVDAPTVTTGDQDLRSIEVALNGLLRRMQEAKLQQMRFVSDASHELRTPIAVIQGYVGMLDRWGKTDPAVLDESIEALKSEADHMQELVEQLLFLARGDSGRTMLERAAFDLAELVDEVAEESQMIDGAHRYVVRAGSGSGWHAGVGEGAGVGGPVTMVGDRAMVKQSMRVIVQNAARYSAPGTAIELGVCVEEGAAGEPGAVGYAVQDAGIGMGERDVAHIFERFYRSDAARDKRAGGTGLGLSIAKWIVDAHGGTIEVLSREGVGTRFTVRFPRSEG